MKKVGLVGLLVLGACASDPPPRAFTAPDGRPAFAITCSESGMSVCYDRARASCGGNYDILQTVDGAVPISNAVTGQIVPLNDQRLYVACAKQLS